MKRHIGNVQLKRSLFSEIFAPCIPNKCAALVGSSVTLKAVQRKTLLVIISKFKKTNMANDMDLRIELKVLVYISGTNHSMYPSNVLLRDN